MSLTGASVFIDFDGTIATADADLHLLERLASTAWRALEASQVSGQIGGRERMIRQWELLPRDRLAIEAAAREVPLDHGFTALAGFLAAAGAEVTILSDGYGFRAEEVGQRAGVRVVTNAVDWERHEVLFPNGNEHCACARCGTCKRAPVEAAKARGQTTVLVGDRADAAGAAEAADVVFAKGELAGWCASQGIAFRRFRTLDDVLVGFLAMHPLVGARPERPASRA